MEKQNYNNHIRFYTPHHFVFYPVAFVLLCFCILYISKQPENSAIWAAMAGVTVLVTWLSFMLRQHYALGNQNRIVRLELRFRYFVLTQKRLEPIEAQLSFGQLAALRFAPDEELPALVDRAVKEQLSGKEIKLAIKNWLPDEMRA